MVLEYFVQDRVESCVGKKFIEMRYKYPATFRKAISNAIEYLYPKIKRESILDIILGMILSGRRSELKIDRSKEGIIETALIGGLFNLGGRKLRAAIYVSDSGNYKEVSVFTRRGDNPAEILSLIDTWVKEKNPLKDKIVNIYGEEESFGSWSWRDIAVPEYFKREIEENLIWPIKYFEKTEGTDLRAPRGVMLEGERGMGKTSITKIIGNMILGHGTFIRARPSDVQALGWDYVFDVAKTLQPSILCIEDVESLAPSEKTPDIAAFLTDFLDYLDGTKERGFVMVLASTNVPSLVELRMIDRPGRIDRRLVLDPREKEFGRPWKEEVLKIHLKGYKLEKTLSVEKLAELIEDIPYTGSHIKELVHTAMLEALRRKGIAEITKEKISRVLLTKEDFEKANERIKGQLEISL